MFIGDKSDFVKDGDGYREMISKSSFISSVKSYNNQVADSLESDIIEIAGLLEPDSVLVMDDDDRSDLIYQMLDSGMLIRLNQEHFPGSYLHRSNINDVARSEKDTYICTEGTDRDVGPTNNWLHTKKALEILTPILRRSMKGKTMYVVPYWLGPIESEFGDAGVEITNNPYVVLNLKIITKVGTQIAHSFAAKNGYVLGVHSTCSLDASERYICHFPELNNRKGLLISVNTDYGGNALLSKKCHALRIASRRARDEGWMAEHMMLIGVNEPGGGKTYIAGAFPSSSGKTNLSMIDPTPDLKKKGWSTELISDDITWINVVKGMPMGINPESGFFGVVPHTSYKTNPNAMKTINRDTVFTNVAVDAEGIPFWEGKEENVPVSLWDWTGNRYAGKGNAAHPNSRFTTSVKQYPYLSREFDNPGGVPISAILYGGRRKDLIPLVFETFSWDEGVLIGATQRVETTAATTGQVGVLRNDPMAMRPFTGYNMAAYFDHHLKMGERMERKPRIYNVNWFRKDETGKFLWPGYSYNMYVLRWIVNRVNEKTGATETPIGYVPNAEEFSDINGVSAGTISSLLHVDTAGFRKELEEAEKFFRSFGDAFPERLWLAFHNMKERIESY